MVEKNDDFSSAGKVCYIFGSGEYPSLIPAPAADDFVIAADGGYTYLKEHGIAVDLVVGDFDSLQAPPTDIKVVILPSEKDDTDMLAAIRVGWERGCRLFHLFGGTGGRLEHTLANIQCLAKLAHLGARGFLYDQRTVITAIYNSKISFAASAKGLISVFAHSNKAVGIDEEGLKYPLVNATLSNTYPLGISNEFMGVPSSIAVKSGTLIIIYPQNIKPSFDLSSR